MGKKLNQSFSIPGLARSLLWTVVVAALLVTTLTAVTTSDASAAPPECEDGVQVGLYCAVETDVEPVETVACPVASGNVTYSDGECFTRRGTLPNGACRTGGTLDPQPFTCRFAVDLRQGTYCLPQGEGLYLQDGACFHDTLAPGVALECPEGELVRNICRVGGPEARSIGRECPLARNIFSADGLCFAFVERVGDSCPVNSTDHADSDRCQQPVSLRSMGSLCEVGFAKFNDCRRFVEPVGLPALDCLGIDAGAAACINRHALSQSGSPELMVGVPTEVVFFRCSGVNPGLRIEDHLGQVFPTFGMAEREPGVYVATFQVDQPGSYGFSLSSAQCPDGQHQGFVSFGATFAGEGIELLLCDNERVTIAAVPGAVTTGTAGNDVILGTSGDDVIDGLGGNDTICGLDGDDAINGGSGSDTVIAGAGDDVVIGGDGEDDISGGEGRDVLRGGPGDDLVAGGPGSDRVLGGIGDDRLDGDGGDDYLGGFGGDDTIVGGFGKEIIFGGFGADFIMGEAGDDTIFGLIGDDQIIGGLGSDTIEGNRGNDDIVGSGGNDTIRGGNANDTIDGREGNDNISGGKADDALTGGLDIDVCIGNLENVADTADDTCETIFGIP